MKCPLLTQFAAHERIVPADELPRLIAEIQANPKKHAERSRRFWWRVELERRAAAA